MKKITKLPINWPTDKQTRRTDKDGWIIIAHPQRATYMSQDGDKWEEIKPALPDNVTPIDRFKFFSTGAS